jgi:putative toxin-antitoxin system antitoxin component (TIGR02293 family)
MKAIATKAVVRNGGRHAEGFLAFQQSIMLSNPNARIERIRKGIDSHFIISVSDHFKVPRESIAKIIGLPTSTMNRKLKAKSVLSSSESERLERIAVIEAEAEEVFGSPEKTKSWMLKNHMTLGNTPLSMLDTDIGANEVRCILNAIAYGGAA